jgi:hypothetical protein
MIDQAPCEICNKLIDSIRFWFGKYLCDVCYRIERSKPQTILISKIHE